MSEYGGAPGFLQELADATNGTITDVQSLPDGSGCAMLSMPLPQDHWIYEDHPEGWDRVRDTFLDTPHPFLDRALIPQLIDALKYAIRGATMCGKVMDFDPDALVQNAIYAMCGPQEHHQGSAVEASTAGEGAKMSDGITDSMIASTDDPYTWEIARIKRAGELDALRYQIMQIQHYFGHYAWCDTIRGGHYKKLGVAIEKAENKLKQMRMLLDEMHRIDGNND